MKVLVTFERLYNVDDPEEAMEAFSRGLQTGEWPGSGLDVPTRTTIYPDVPEGIKNVEQLLQ